MAEMIDKRPYLHCLPTEILGLICAQLCPHCTPVLQNHERPHRTALYALCLTSKHICTIAQPVLYHFICRPLPYRIIRTLYNRPDLASCVKHYSQRVPPPWWRTFDGESEVVAEMARSLQVHEPAYTDFGNAKQRSIRLETICNQIAIALLPNISILRYVVENSDGSCSYTSARFRERQKPGLPHMRCLTIVGDFNWGFCIPCPAVTFFLTACPNLERLVLRGIRGLNQASLKPGDLEKMIPSLPRLRSLEFDNSMFESNSTCLPLLREIIKGSENLESFRLHYARTQTSRNDEPVSPASQILQVLMPHRHTLKKLELDFVDLWWDFHRLEGGTFVTCSALRQFTNLEKLKLGSESFCEHFYGSESDSESPCPCLTNILPPQIKTIQLNMSLDDNSWKHVNELATQVLAGGFSSLQQIDVVAKRWYGSTYGDAELQAVRARINSLGENFAETSVAFSIRTEG